MKPIKVAIMTVIITNIIFMKNVLYSQTSTKATVKLGLQLVDCNKYQFFPQENSYCS